jgi:hypothetical protein
VVCRLSVDDLRASLHRVIAAAHRRKALTHAELPWHVVALDGKATSLPSWDDAFVQRHTPEQGLPYGLLRTVTCALVSAPGRPCLDAIPIPVHTNEMGHFQFALGQLLATYGELFQVVTYDAGASSEANGRAVVTSVKYYVFRLRNEPRYMHRLAAELCAADAGVGECVDALANRTTVTRRLTVVAVERHWAYGRSGEKSVAADGSIWEHTRTLLRIESVRCRDDVVVEREVRFWNTSLRHDALTPAQWLHLLRSHWGVENNNHYTLDTAFAEDERPWITGDGTGALAVVLLRRIAYTLLTLFRSVTQRSEARRAMPWKALLALVRDTLVGVSGEEVAGLRKRGVLAAFG